MRLLLLLARLKLSCRFDGKVGQDTIGTRPFEREQALEHYPVPVEPTLGGRRREHRVFATYLIGKRRHLERGFDPGHDVQVRHTWLDHDHVRPLSDIESDL